MCINSQRRRPILVLLAATVVWLAAPDSGADPSARALDAARVTFESPTLFYSTTFGGGTSEARDIAIDAAGNTIIAGNTTERFNFPLVNAADSVAGTEGEEGYIAKINAAGDDLIFSTYLGGQGNDWITDIDVDAAGNVYVVGVTAATDFPTTGGSVQPSAGNTGNSGRTDAFVAKLDPLGNLLWSTYLGGEDTDEAHGIKVGSDGTVYVVGTAKSPNFPTANAVQDECTPLGSGFTLCQDAFVSRLSANGSSLLFSTFLGGKSLGEVACSVDVDSDGNVFVVGHHSSDNFPFVNAFQDSYEGGFDMFVAKFAAGGGSIDWASGLGGSGNESICGALYRGPTIALNAQGDAFVAGVTDSTDIPADGFQTTNAGTTDGYLAKITSDGTLAWGSYLGGTNSEAITEIAVLANGGAAVVGWSTSRDFPQTDNALEQSDCPGSPVTSCSGDVFVGAIAADGSEIDFSTLLGSSAFDQANGVAVAADGALYVAGTTRSGVWPLVEPLPAPFLGSGGTQSFAVRISYAGAPIAGDVNGSGTVTASDALAALNVALGAGQCLLCVCDLNGDGSISATDALFILNIAVGLPVAANAPACC